MQARYELGHVDPVRERVYAGVLPMWHLRGGAPSFLLKESPPWLRWDFLLWFSELERIFLVEPGALSSSSDSSCQCQTIHKVIPSTGSRGEKRTIHRSGSPFVTETLSWSLEKPHRCPLPPDHVSQHASGPVVNIIKWSLTSTVNPVRERYMRASYRCGS